MALPKKQALYASEVMDWGFLDRQLPSDPHLVDYMCKGDLLALCAHHVRSMQDTCWCRCPRRCWKLVRVVATTSSVHLARLMPLYVSFHVMWQEGHRHATAGEHTTLEELRLRVLAYLKGQADGKIKSAISASLSSMSSSSTVAARGDGGDCGGNTSNGSSSGGGGGVQKQDAHAALKADVAKHEAVVERWLRHHYLQHAPSDHAVCSRCRCSIPLGQVRLGRPFKPPVRLWHQGEHAWVAWSHLRCLTQWQAKRLLAHAEVSGSTAAAAGIGVLVFSWWCRCCCCCCSCWWRGGGGGFRL